MATKSMYQNGSLTFFDPAKKYLVTARHTRNQFVDNFSQYTTIPAAASRANGNPWVKDITGAAPPTVGFVADAIGGVVECALTSASQAQDASAHWDDNRHICLDNGPVVQFYAKLTVLPTLLAIGHLGLIGDNGTDFAGTTYNAGFTIAAGGAVSAAIDDNATPTTASTGVTLTVDTWYAFRIEAFLKSAIRFFINGALVAGSTTYNYAASAGANSTLQPIFGIGKASGAGVGTLQVANFAYWQD